DLFETLFDFELRFGVVARVGERRRDVGDVRDAAGCGLSQCMLMQYVAGYGVQISLRVPYGFVVVETKKTQEDLLHEVRHVGRGVAHPARKVPAACLPVSLLQGTDEGVLGLRGHRRSSLS